MDGLKWGDLDTASTQRGLRALITTGVIGQRTGKVACGTRDRASYPGQRFFISTQFAQEHFHAHEAVPIDTTQYGIDMA